MPAVDLNTQKMFKNNLMDHMTEKALQVPENNKSKDAAYFTKIPKQHLPELSKNIISA